MEQYHDKKYLIISCGMLSDELKTVCQKYDFHYKIMWMKRSLHNDPKSLKDTLQSVINEHQDFESILLTYGLCGNGTVGIKSEHTRLVIPRFHDCIHQLLQNVDNGAIEKTLLWKKPERGHMYLTRSWTLDKEAMYQQSLAILQKYGHEQGSYILNEIYGSYTEIDVIDTNSYKMDPVLHYAKKAAEPNHMKVNQIKGSTVILEKLLMGDWDNNFIILNPGEELKQNHFFII